MAKDDGAKFILGAGALALFWGWWKNRKAAPLSTGGPGNTGGTQGSGCGCSGLPGQTTMPYQPANPSSPRPIRSRPQTVVPLTSAGPIMQSSLDPPATPGGNASAASGSASQWQGVTYSSPGVLSGAPAPLAPRIQTGPSVLTGNARPRSVS
jgi:hypothetical protein